MKPCVICGAPVPSDIRSGSWPCEQCLREVLSAFPPCTCGQPDGPPFHREDCLIAVAATMTPMEAP